MPKTNLVIVESPAKAKTIGKYLGRDYQVIASMGHIRDLPKSKLGVDIDADQQPLTRGLIGNPAQERLHLFGAVGLRRGEFHQHWMLHRLLE